MELLTKLIQKYDKKNKNAIILHVKLKPIPKLNRQEQD